MIQESTPEKRNLLVISILIIIFVCGGAVFSAGETKFKLSLISVELENIGFLVFLIWASLIYCIYRYYVVCTEPFKQNYHADIISVINTEKHHQAVIGLIGGPKLEKRGQGVPKPFVNVYQALDDFHRECKQGNVEATDSLVFEKNPEKTSIQTITKKIDEQNAFTSLNGVDFVSEGVSFSKPKRIHKYIILASRNSLLSGELLRERSLNIPFNIEQNREILVDLIFKRPSLSDYFLPWVMALLAILLLWIRGVQDYPKLFLFVGFMLLILLASRYLMAKKRR